jgi:AraC-like DNA-binding protein
MLSPQVVVASRILAPLLQHAERVGVDVAALCAARGVRLLRDDAGTLPANIEVSIQAQRELFDDVAARLGDPLLGLRLGLQIPRGAYGLLEFAAHVGPDLQSVIDVTILSVPLVSAVVAVDYAIDGDVVHFHHKVGVEGGYGRQAAEMTLASIWTGGRRAVGDELRASSWWFQHEAPDATTVRAMEGLLGCPVRFGAADNGFTFPAALLRLPTRLHDEGLHAFLVAQAHKELALRAEVVPFVRQVDNVVAALLAARREVTPAPVAKALALSVRTLQRRLGELGTNFSSIVERARERQARLLLKEPGARVDEVAHALGFQDVSSFSKAFRRWTGVAPSMFRSVDP